MFNFSEKIFRRCANVDEKTSRGKNFRKGSDSSSDLHFLRGRTTHSMYYGPCHIVVLFYERVLGGYKNIVQCVLDFINKC